MIECVNRSEKLRYRAYHVLAKKHRNWKGARTLARFALEVHTMKLVGPQISRLPA